MYKKFLSAGLVSLMAFAVHAEFPLSVKDGKISYVTDARGNRTLDYSTCGYRNSEVAIPNVGNAIFVPWQTGDNSARIQRAIDHIASLPLDKDGFRGAVLLDKGEFEIATALRISASGVVLRGSSETATVIKKTGPDRGALIYVEGIFNPVVSDTISITDTYVPVNSSKIGVNSTASFHG